MILATLPRLQTLVKIFEVHGELNCLLHRYISSSYTMFSESLHLQLLTNNLDCPFYREIHPIHLQILAWEVFYPKHRIRCVQSPYTTALVCFQRYLWHPGNQEKTKNNKIIENFKLVRLINLTPNQPTNEDYYNMQTEHSLLRQTSRLHTHLL